MADPTFFELFKATWAQNGLTEGITDVQYKTGWAYIGSIPPSVEQFNKVQQTTDERLGWIYNQLEALAAVTGRPLLATSADALSFALQNLNATNLKSGTVPVARLSGTATSLTAGAAQKLATSRTIAVTGDATGSGNFDGSANLSFGLTLADSGVYASSYGAASSIPTFTVDSKGRITQAGAVAVGNAATATKLATARSFSISGGATAAAANFDGSGNVVLNVTGLDLSKATAGTLGVVRGGTGLATVSAGSFLSGAGTGALVPRTPAQVLDDIQALSRSGGTITGAVTLGTGSGLGALYGANDTSSRTAHVVLPDGGGFSTHLSSVVGAMKIKLPPIAVGRNSMIRLRVDIFEYSADFPPMSLLIQGYAQSSKAWARCGVVVIGGNPASDMPVRFGSDAAGDLCLWLGDLARLWQYPTVSVSEVHAKYNTPGASVETWGTGWKVEPVTAFETVSLTLASGNLAFARSDIPSVNGLQAALDQKADAARQIIAGNGMSGGGTLAANRTLTLGTPGSITKDSTNSVSATSHTHQLSVSAADIGAAPATSSIVAGNGLTGGGTLASSRTLTLGTPGTLTAASTNAVQNSSHTHALDTQTSQMDATAGRILTVGAFGLGADNLLGTLDLNTVKIPAIYGQSLSANATPARNYPTNRAGKLIVGSGGPQIVTQLYQIYNTGEIYTRGGYNDIWSDWNYHPGMSFFPMSAEARAGIIQLATIAQVRAFVDDSTALTPKKFVDALNAVTGSQVYLSPGTFTWPRPVGVTKVKVRVIGGGGGGACDNVAPGPSGGGQGGYWEGVFDVSALASVPVTVGAGGAGATVTGTDGGAGGASSFGTFCSALGGAGGTRNANASAGGKSSGTIGFGWSGGAGSIGLRDAYGTGFVGGAGGGFMSPFGSVDNTRQGCPGVGGGGRINSAAAPGAHGAVIIEW
ncbi:pyocin knob domain-containing protein [Achromobacter insolitus]|uniref:pyocin knob domain-containing protein n=1 Tax=Achromobacter insolitus TaxID=217204 RepID=UPI0027E168B1|nr:pyocin knob domain-containing protein [Achromobacter insolitus]MDQ6213314.1 pyocin knob domain-containing protein [Achromobacter insolitus]